MNTLAKRVMYKANPMLRVRPGDVIAVDHEKQEINIVSSNDPHHERMKALALEQQKEQEGTNAPIVPTQNADSSNEAADLD